MFKFLVIGVLLWHETLAGVSDQQPDNFTSFPKEQADRPNENNVFHFHGTQQSITFNVPFSGSPPSVTHENSASTTVKPTIRADYKVTDGIGAHKVYANKLTWNKARVACKSDGGQLAVIRSDAEQNVIVQMMSDNSVDNAWLGLHDLFENGDWVSVDDESIEEIGWSKWAPNPDKYHGNQHCARLLTEGNGMNNFECEATRSFVCKIQT